MSAISLEARRDVGAWTFSGSLEAASARVDTLNVSGLWTSAWSLSAQHPFAGGAMRAMMWQAGGGMMVPGMQQGSIWGTDIYTLDSTLGLAALHAGVLKQGQTGTVKVTILGPQPAFLGSVRNGVTTNDYGRYGSAYRVDRI